MDQAPVFGSLGPLLGPKRLTLWRVTALGQRERDLQLGQPAGQPA
jgi:hypothetical protein